jgi:hypothetical protein
METMVRTKNALMVGSVLVCAGALVGCGDGSCHPGYPAAPAGASEVVHVAASCHDDAPDGSADHPYSTITAALAAAKSGAAIVVAAGHYPENLKIDKPVSIVGSNDGNDADDAAIILQAPNANAIYIEKVAKPDIVLLQGVVVVDPGGTGVWASSASVTVTGSRILGAAPAGTAGPGYGVYASEDAAIILQHSEVSGSASRGVLVFESEAAYIVQNRIHDNAGGGIRLEHAIGEVQIEGNLVDHNVGAGIFVGSSVAYIVQNNQITGTQEPSGDQPVGGDGVVVTEVKDHGKSLGPAEAHIDNATITGSGRTGILCSGDVKAYIVQSTISSNGMSAMSANRFGAGVWVQSGAGVGGAGVSPDKVDPKAGIVLRQSTLKGNALVGVGATSVARLIATDNVIDTVVEGTVPDSFTLAPVPTANGFGVFAGASIQAAGNTITSCPVFGVFMDSPRSDLVTFQDNTLKGYGEYGIILQNAGAMPPDVSKNTFDPAKPMMAWKPVAAGTYGFAAPDQASQ